MKIVEAPYTLLDRGHNEWRFSESSAMATATEVFDSILEKNNGYHGGWSSRLAGALRKFLQKHPDHIDALHHYASCLLHDDQDVEALAFSHTAVATGMRFFPRQFTIGKDRLPTGYIQNRPFIRAVHGLMLAQRNLSLINEAISTAEMCLSLDEEDRMGARESLAIYLLESNRNRNAIELFEKPLYKENFRGAQYLFPLALVRIGENEKARKSLAHCLYYYPQVARFILNRALPQPEGDSRFGATWGSELEGWIYARQFGAFWRADRKAMTILQEESVPYVNRGWQRDPNTKAPASTSRNGA